jgi:hypothetical protein
MPFDATLKDLASGYPRDFLTAFDAAPTLPVSLLNVDLSTVTTSADLVVGLGEPLREIVHIDFQSAASADKHADVLVYNSLLFRLYGVPVHSIIILLRPQAAHSNLSGTVHYAARPLRGNMQFSYEVVRVWERPAEDLLQGSLGTAPLAVLGRLPDEVAVPDALRAVAQRLITRLENEASPEQTRRLLTAAFVLVGMRVHRDLARVIFQGVRTMRESDTYMAIIDEGRELEVKKLLVRLGQKRFGAPDSSITARLEGVTDLNRLERMSDRLFDASGWADLLNTP